MPESGGERREYPAGQGPFFDGGAKIVGGVETWYGRCVSTGDRGEFYAIVVESQTALARMFPGLVSRDGDGYRIDVAREREYTATLAGVIVQRYGGLLGICATPGGPNDEVGVKNSNGYSEQYDVVVSNGKIWANKTVKCRPARF
jgi:hypothetical protein